MTLVACINGVRFPAAYPLYADIPYMLIFLIRCLFLTGCLSLTSRKLCISKFPS